MSPARLGQSQVITAVLLGGILVAGISAAYVWGIPILQKNQDVNNAERSLDTLRQVADGIATVASDGGSRSVTVSLGDGTLSIDTDKEMISYRALTQGAYVSTQNWVPLNEDDMQGVNRTTGEPTTGYGIRGADSPAVLIGKAQISQDAFTTFYRIISRRLFEPGSAQTYYVDLVQNGNLEASGEEHTVVFQRDGTETVPGEGVNGGTLRRIRILIRVS